MKYTVRLPTCHLTPRATFDRVGGYVEELGEDLRFLMRHLELGGGLFKVDEPLVVYRHVGGSLCSSTPRKVGASTMRMLFKMQGPCRSL